MVLAIFKFLSYDDRVAKEKNIGTHAIADLGNINPKWLLNKQDLLTLLEEALDRFNFTRIQSMSYQFPGEGSGFTAIVLLSESHASIHTYPEYQYLALDIFSCGNQDPELVLNYLIEKLEATEIKRKIILRKSS